MRVAVCSAWLCVAAVTGVVGGCGDAEGEPVYGNPPVPGGSGGGMSVAGGGSDEFPATGGSGGADGGSGGSGDGGLGGPPPPTCPLARPIDDVEDCEVQLPRGTLCEYGDVNCGCYYGWECAEVDPDCPEVPDEHSDCGDQQGLECLYPGIRCMCGDDREWGCQDFRCPLDPPAHGSTCDNLEFGTFCVYPRTMCACSFNDSWDCEFQ